MGLYGVCVFELLCYYDYLHDKSLYERENRQKGEVYGTYVRSQLPALLTLTLLASAFELLACLTPPGPALPMEFLQDIRGDVLSDLSVVFIMHSR